MPDLRLSWARKFSHLSPSTFQAAQLDSKREEREDDEVDERPAERPRKRQRYTPEDFQTPFATPREVREWWEKFPALQKRNFYVVQNHYATADHFDLRLHLDGRTISWAIPKTLHNPAALNMRQAIETSPHSVSYSLLEGAVASGMSTTGVWDIGTYTVLETKRTTSTKNKLRAEGLEDHETTDEESASLQPEDERQEDLFRDAVHYITFQATPAVEGRAGQPAKRDSGNSRGIVVELNGERYKRLRLTFTRPSNDVRLKRNTRFSATETKREQLETLRLYLLHLSCPDGHSLRDTEVPPSILDPSRSLLTGRTMAQIRADGVRWMAELTGGGEGGECEEGEGDESTPEEEAQRLGKAARRILHEPDDRRRGRRHSRRDGRALAREVQRLLEDADEAEMGVLVGGVEGEERSVLRDLAADVQVNGFRN